MQPAEAAELFTWIDNLEVALANLQQAVTDLFVASDNCSRRTLLEQVISRRQIWLERPVDEIQLLISMTKDAPK